MTRFIILAAGSGRRLGDALGGRPKCLAELGGRSLLARQLDAARRAGLRDITVVGGYRAECLAPLADDLVVNDEFDTTNMVASLFRAEEMFADDFVMSYGDIAYRDGVLTRLLASAHPVSVVVDRDWRSYWEQRFSDPLVDAESLRLDGRGGITGIGGRPAAIEDIQGQYIGLVRFRGSGIEALRRAYRDAFSARTMFMTDMLQMLIDTGVAVTAVEIDGGWVEIDHSSDLAVAERLVAEGRLDG